MSRILRTTICLIGSVLLLAGCKIDESASADQQQSAAGDPTQAAAEQEAGPNQPQPDGWPGPDGQMGEVFQQLNRLAISTLYLQSTDHPITGEQAVVLLPLWQSLQSSMQPAERADNAPGAPVDDTRITPILDSIEMALTAEQKEILSAQPQEQLWAWAGEQGLMGAGFGGPPGDGTPGLGRGNGQGGTWGDGTPGAGPGGLQGTPRLDLTPPADFTPGARGNRGEFGFGSPLIDAVIQMLQDLAGQ